MNTFIKRPSILLLSVAFSGWAVLSFFSCQKADPNPYSTPEAGVTHTVVVTYTSTTTHTPPDTTTSFLASVNSSAVITFTPNKHISGSTVSLNGVSSFYTISIIMPTSTGPGNYSVGFGGGISFRLVNGSTVYLVNNSMGTGNLDIDSITNNKYYGTFDFIADDSTNSFNSMTVNQGSFNHL